MIVNLHIDRVVIDGLPLERRDAPMIESALSEELTRLIGEGGAQGLGGRRFDPVVRTEPIMRTARDAGGLGRQIGRAVHGAIGK